MIRPPRAVTEKRQADAFQLGETMFATPATVLSAFATLLAVFVLIYTFGQAGRMRARHKIIAPAIRNSSAPCGCR